MRFLAFKGFLLCAATAFLFLGGCTVQTNVACTPGEENCDCLAGACNEGRRSIDDRI